MKFNVSCEKAIIYVESIKSNCNDCSSQNCIKICDKLDLDYVTRPASINLGKQNIDCNDFFVDAGPDQTICTSNQNSVTLSASGADNYYWTSSDNSPITNNTSQSITVSPQSDVVYTVRGTRGNCESTDQCKVRVFQSINIEDKTSTICQGGNTKIGWEGNDGFTYLWDGIPNNNVRTPVVSPKNTTVYTCHISNGTCSAIARHTVIVKKSPDFTFSASSTSICPGDYVKFTVNISNRTPDEKYYIRWFNTVKESTSDLTESFEYSNKYTEIGTKHVCISVEFDGCTSTKCIDITVKQKKMITLDDDRPEPETKSVYSAGDIISIPIHTVPLKDMVKPKSLSLDVQFDTSIVEPVLNITTDSNTVNKSYIKVTHGFENWIEKSSLSNQSLKIDLNGVALQEYGQFYISFVVKQPSDAKTQQNMSSDNLFDLEAKVIKVNISAQFGGEEIEYCKMLDGLQYYFQTK